jgi:hypothetical protein
MKDEFSIHQYKMKPLREYEKGDLIIVRKIVSGFDYNYLCHFKEIQRGVVIADIIMPSRPYDRRSGEISARASKCYIWHEGQDDKWKRCYWFRDGLDALPR